jgi:hypothetical protein
MIDTAFPVRKALGFTAEQWERVKEFRFDQRIPTEADAVRRLIDLGLETAGAKGAKPKGAKR